MHLGCQCTFAHISMLRSLLLHIVSIPSLHQQHGMILLLRPCCIHIKSPQSSNLTPYGHIPQETCELFAADSRTCLLTHEECSAEETQIASLSCFPCKTYTLSRCCSTAEAQQPENVVNALRCPHGPHCWFFEATLCSVVALPG